MIGMVSSWMSDERFVTTDRNLLQTVQSTDKTSLTLARLDCTAGYSLLLT